MVARRTRKASDAFGREINEDAIGTRKLFWKVKNVRNRVRNNCVTIRERHKRLLINQGEARSRPRGGVKGYFATCLMSEEWKRRR